MNLKILMIGHNKLYVKRIEQKAEHFSFAAAYCLPYRDMNSIIVLAIQIVVIRKH